MTGRHRPETDNLRATARAATQPFAVRIRRSGRAAPTLLFAPGPVPWGRSIGIDDGKPGRKPGLVSNDADFPARVSPHRRPEGRRQSGRTGVLPVGHTPPDLAFRARL